MVYQYCAFLSLIVLRLTQTLPDFTIEMKDNSMGYVVRAPEDNDAEGLLALVGGCFSEYPEVVLEPDGVDADLKAYASALRDAGGKGYVLELEESGEIIGLAAGGPTNNISTYQLKRLYLNKKYRGEGGTAQRLLTLVEADALAREKVTHLELWSDTRFERAHRFYEREGFVRTGRTRELHDLSASIEYHFIKKLK